MDLFIFSKVKKPLAFIFLLLHINFSMFIPQMEETDSFDANGMPTDDINSLVEYIDQVMLNNIDDTPEDEDDDYARNYSPVQNGFYYTSNASEIIPSDFPDVAKVYFPEFPEVEIPSISFDVIAPPPKG